MTQFHVDDDLVALVWEKAKPRPFENLSFSEALRRVLAMSSAQPESKVAVSNKSKPISADELLAELDAWDKDQLENFQAQMKDKIRLRAASPSPEEWVAKVPELRSVAKLHTWKSICDHLKIKVGGDSARRKLDDWVKNNRPTWPSVPNC